MFLFKSYILVLQSSYETSCKDRCLVTPPERKCLPRQRNQGKQHGKHAEQGWNEGRNSSYGRNFRLLPSRCGITDLLPLLDQPVAERLEIPCESTNIHRFASSQLLESLRPRFTLSHLQHVTRGNAAKNVVGHVLYRFVGNLSTKTFLNHYNYPLWAITT